MSSVTVNAIDTADSLEQRGSYIHAHSGAHIHNCPIPKPLLGVGTIASGQGMACTAGMDQCPDNVSRQCAVQDAPGLHRCRHLTHLRPAHSLLQICCPGQCSWQPETHVQSKQV